MVMRKLEYKLMVVSLAGILSGLAGIGYYESQKQTKEPVAVARFYGNNKSISEIKRSLIPPNRTPSRQRWDLSNPENINYITSLQQKLSTLMEENKNLSQQPDVSAVIRKNEEYENYARYGACAVVVGSIMWALAMQMYFNNLSHPLNKDTVPEHKVL